MRVSETRDIDVRLLRAALGDIIQSGRFDDWLAEVPDRVLVQVAAPFEMLAFQFYLDPPQDRHLVRAARVACETVENSSADCPADMSGAFRRLSALVFG
jgi:hypothetical protein